MNVIDGLAVFYDDDLPNMASHRPQWECGHSIYRGVLVQWDEDHDARVLEVIDGLPEAVRGELLVIQEHEASLALLWRGPAPNRYLQGGTIDVSDDTWYIALSIGPVAIGNVAMRLAPERAKRITPW